MNWFVGFVVAAGACMPAYTFDRAPLPEATQSAQASCYRAKRFQLLRGDATWSAQHQSGDYLITEYWAAQGIAFRRGDERLDAVDAIATLPDPELVKGYRSLLDDTEGPSNRYPLYRNVAFGLALGGLGITVGALGIALTDPENDAILPIALTGAAVAVLSVIPTILASTAYKGAIQHDLDRHLYRRAEWAGRMYGAVQSYNQRVAQECQYESPDVPMTPGASALIQSSVRAPQAPTMPPPFPPNGTPPAPSGPPGAP